MLIQNNIKIKGSSGLLSISCIKGDVSDVFHLVLSGKVLSPGLFWVLCWADGRGSQPLKKSQLEQGCKNRRTGLYMLSGCHFGAKCRNSVSVQDEQQAQREPLGLKAWAGRGIDLRSAEKRDKTLHALQAPCFWAPRPKDHSYKIVIYSSTFPSLQKKQWKGEKMVG